MTLTKEEIDEIITSANTQHYSVFDIFNDIKTIGIPDGDMPYFELSKTLESIVFKYLQTEHPRALIEKTNKIDAVMNGTWKIEDDMEEYKNMEKKRLLNFLNWLASEDLLEDKNSNYLKNINIVDDFLVETLDGSDDYWEGTK